MSEWFVIIVFLIFIGALLWVTEAAIRRGKKL
jgi:hypothetical protein